MARRITRGDAPFSSPAVRGKWRTPTCLMRMPARRNVIRSSGEKKAPFASTRSRRRGGKA